MFTNKSLTTAKSVYSISIYKTINEVIVAYPAASDTHPHSSVLNCDQSLKILMQQADGLNAVK